MEKKTQEQLLKEALPLITMIDGLRDSCVPKIMELMINKQFVDAGVPVNEGMVVVGDVMTDYQKALATLTDNSRTAHNRLASALLQTEGELHSNDTKMLANLKEEYTALNSSFWSAIFKTHENSLNPTGHTVLVEVEGFRIAEQEVPVCPHCGERHLDDDMNGS